jgi:hypothetical protein
LSLSLDEITQLVTKMEKEVRAIKDEIVKMCWFMRGGITLVEMYNTDYEDRDVIAKLIESNLETTNKTKMPFF